jgi:hypothetical protein
MASLDKSNVVNGNTISASDITALYDAFTGTTTYDNIDFTGTSSNANLIKYVDDNTNKFYEVPFLATESLGSYVPILTDTNNSFQYNPSTETLKATNFEGTGSYITGSNVQGPVEIAQNLDTFQVIDLNQNPTSLLNPRPIAFTLQYSGPWSGSIDLNSVVPGIQSTQLGDDLFILAQEMTSPGILDTANSLTIRYTAPVLEITSSATPSSPNYGVLVTGWARK